MSNVVLLTGATGFLGSQIARQLIQTTDYTLVVLVRAASGTDEPQRLRRSWWDWPETVGAIGNRVEILCCKHFHTPTALVSRRVAQWNSGAVTGLLSH